MKETDTMSDFQFFMPLSKIDEDKRIVYGYASTPTKDSDGEIVTLDAIKDALPGYMEYANVREMHALKAVGVTEEANIDDKGLFISAKIIDDDAWKKCREGVYKGFSIGGKKLSKTGNKITEIEMSEISVVDRPSNPDARFELAKSAKTIETVENAAGYLIKAKKFRSTESKALSKMAKIVENLAKAGPPAAHDGFSLPAKTVAEAKPDPKDAKNDGAETNKSDAASRCEAHGEVGCEKCAAQKAEGKAADAPYGDVEYADNGLQADGEKRYPIDTEEHIRAAWNYINKPKNAAKYGDKTSSVKAKIVAAWKKKIDENGPPSAKKDKKDKKAMKKVLGIASGSFLSLSKRLSSDEPVLPLELELKKSMAAAGQLSYTFDSIRSAQRSLMQEAKREGGDMKDKALALELGGVAQKLSAIISQKALHEGQEALDFSDADDQYISSLFGKDFDMSKALSNVSSTTGDPLTDAVAALMKRAAQPTRAQRMAMADDQVKKSRKACKAAREAVEEAHKMHKSAYLSKAAKSSKKPSDDDGDEFDHAGAMEKLQKAYAEIDKARTMAKAASNQIEKAMASRSGQKGQEVSDADGEFYSVPNGIRALSPSDMATASPGGNERGSEPPLYPTDGSVYAGKSAGNGNDLMKYAKDGKISAEVAGLLMEKMKAEGELQALRNLPMSSAGGRRPYSFDLNKAFGGPVNGSDSASLNKALFHEVNPADLSSDNEQVRTKASATVAGNLLLSGQFGKSIFDPNFNGAVISR